MDKFLENPERNPRTIAVIGIGFAPNKSSQQLLQPIIQPEEETITVGPLDITLNTELTNRRNLPTGHETERTIIIEIGEYLVAAEITITRLS